MITYNKPTKSQWLELAKRPAINQESLNTTVSDIMEAVNQKGDIALSEFGRNFDGVDLATFKVSDAEINKAIEAVNEELKQAIQLAYSNILSFHQSQLSEDVVVTTSPGVNCWRKSVPIEKVGLYIPGGSAPLFSTVLMLGIPAKLVGCDEVIICTPPNQNGEIHPAILYTANLIGITQVFKVGGAQAIAAMSYGTETIPNVYKIFGPGNQYVTKAKELAQLQGVGIDMPAGPSEVLVIADQTGIPEFIAADLLSQAEHGADSQVILLTNDENILSASLDEVAKQLQDLPRKEIANQALENSKAILFDDIDECFRFSNQYAPEHLIIASQSAISYADKVVNAGSVFLGNYSCESAGDYASGTNHTLPTNGYAKQYSGVSTDSFVKQITFQELNQTGIKTIGNAVEIMAEAEGLIGHKNAVTVRLKSLNNV